MRRCVALLVIASILFVSCASAWQSRAVQTEEGYKIVWQPEWNDGYKLLAIAYIPLEDGKHALRVYIDDTRVYQRIETTSNVAGTTWMRHTVEWELIANLKPEQAATEDGWRDSSRRHRYIMRQFEDAAGNAAMDLYSDGYKNYWLSVSEYGPRAVPVRGTKLKQPPIRSTAGE